MSGELGVCCRVVHESLFYHVERLRDRVQMRPPGHRCAGRGLAYGPGPTGKRLDVGPQHVFDMWAAAPSRLRASVRGFDVIHELYYLSLRGSRFTMAPLA